MISPGGARPGKRGIRAGRRVAVGRGRRGVVLIFVVAVLVLLVILATAFYSTVRSQALLQANRRNAFQAELASQSGVTQAARHLRALGNAALMPDANVVVGLPQDATAGHFSWGDGWLKTGAGDWVRMPGLYQIDDTTGVRQEIAPSNIFTQAQIDETAAWPSPLDPTTFRWSWANFWVDDHDRTLRPADPDAPLIQPLVRNMTNTDNIVVWPYFPGMSLAHAANPGELEGLTASWSRGRRWVLTPNQVLARDRPAKPGDLDFFEGDVASSTYNPNFRHILRTQQVDHPGYGLELTGAENPASPPLAFSGYIDYRMVATDLDSRLYLPIGRWVPSILAGTANDRLDGSKGYGVTNRQIILKTLNDLIAAQLAATTWNSQEFPSSVRDRFATDDNVQTWGDLWEQAALTDPAGYDTATLPVGDLTARNDYLFRKYLVPRSFNVYPPRFQPDAANGGEDYGRPADALHRPALNINTASREVLAANFAAALLTEDSAPATLGSVSPDELALRIMRCRPFFSRVDWEDFLAANLELTAFANVVGAVDARLLNATDTADSGGPLGRFLGTDVTTIPGWDKIGHRERLLWFRDQIALSSASRLTLKGFNALINASRTTGGKSYYAFTATVTYTEDGTNPGNPITVAASWTEAGVPQSLSVPLADFWVAAQVDHLTEWNLTDDATLKPAWDTSAYKYMWPTGGELPDGWGAVDRAQPVIVAMPIKLRSGLFEIVSRGRYIQYSDHIPAVRAVHKEHAVYDTVNHLYWMRRELIGEKGALNDP